MTKPTHHTVQHGDVKVATAAVGNQELDTEASRMLTRWRHKGYFVENVAIVLNPLDMATFIAMYVLVPVEPDPRFEGKQAADPADG